MPESIINQLGRMASQSMEWKSRYEEKKDKWPFNQYETVFLPIRHFNSATPITPGPYNSVPYNIAERPLKHHSNGTVKLQPALIGGGYYLGHKLKGIAIDPGYEFVDVLHRYHDLTVYHIDTVVITHDHMDHHADLETIINLRRGAGEPLKIFANKEVIEAYGLKKRQWVESVNIIIHEVEPGAEVELLAGVTAKILPCMHWQRIRELDFQEDKIQTEEVLKKHFNAFGLQLNIENGVKRILITGDTLFPIRLKTNTNTWKAYGGRFLPYADDRNGRKLGWTSSQFNEDRARLLKMIDAQCEKMINAYRSLKKSDVVCLHLGSLEKGFADEDIDITPSENSPEKAIIERLHDPLFCYRGFHLGLMGGLRILELLTEKNGKDAGFDPKEGLVILTEFGEELLGNRQNLCTILCRLASSLRGWDNIHPSVIPSEVTLYLLLDSQIKESHLGVQCSYCDRIHDWKETIGEEGPGEIINYLVKGATDGKHHNCSYLR